MKHLLILLTTLHFFTVGSIKANNNYNNNLKEVTYTNNLMTQSFPKYYQLYLIIVRDANGNGGWTNENLSNLESELQNVYGSKEIYFNLCITEIHDSYWYYNGVSQGYAESFLNTFKLNYSDGIKGILVKGGGWSANDHTKRFSADDVPTALHELGHCLGLLHTWEHPSSGQPVCGELAPKKNADGTWTWGANATFTGDLVEDTPADLTRLYSDCPISGQVQFVGCVLSNPLEILDAVGTEYTDVPDPSNPSLNYLGHNIMTYNTNDCRKLITPGQAQRIKEWVELNRPEIQRNGAVTKVYKKNFYISNDIRWENEEIIIDGDLFIVGNGRLTLSKCTVYFTPGHKIQIVPGTELSIAHSTIDVDYSTSCFNISSGDTWEGIVVDYTNANQNSGTPLIDIYDSYLKNADIAISTFGLPDGGINNLDLVVLDGKFVDNKQSIQLKNAEGIIEISLSKFTYNRYEDEPKAQLKFDYSTLWIADSEIINTSNSTSIQFSGIETYNSNVLCSENLFEHWSHGVYRGWGAGSTMTLFNNNFKNNYSSHLKTANRYSNFIVLKNHFLENFGGIGIDISDAYTDLEILNNFFDDSDIGIKFSGVAGNQCYFSHNDFTKMRFSAIDFLNFSYNYSPIFLCSKFNDGGSVDHILTSGGINYEQATITKEGSLASAGNIFAGLSQGHYNFKADVEGVKYYWIAPNEEPKNYLTIIPTTADYEAVCPDNIFNDGPNDYEPGDGVTTKEEEDWRVKKDKQDSIITFIDFHIDGGDSVTVISVINDVVATNTDQVSGYLTELGPWLSENAALAFITNSGMFTGSQIVSVLAASPDVFANNTISQFAFGPNSPLNTNQQAQLKAATQRTTERTKLKAQVDKLDAEINHTIAKAIHKITFTSNGRKNYDNLRMWTARKATFSSRLDIAELYFRERNYNQCIAYLSDMLGDRKLSKSQINDVIQYRTIMTMLKTVYLDRRYEGNLTNAEKDILFSIANSGQTFSMDKARGILEYYYGYEFDEMRPRAMEPKKFTSPATEPDDAIVNISPNPNHGSFEIVVKDDKALLLGVQIYDLTGKIVYEKKYETGSQKVTVSIDGYQNGTYLYSVWTSDGQTGNGKIIIE